METKQRLLRLIKLAHGIVDKPDLEKHRQSQDQIGELIGRVKDLTFQDPSVTSTGRRYLVI